MHFTNILTLGLLAGTSFATLAPSSYVRHEHRAFHHSSRYARRDRAPSDTRMPVKIAIAQRNLDRGHELLMEVSDPRSPKFGKHYSPQEVSELFAPHRDSFDSVSEWLSQSGIGSDRHSIPRGRSWIQFDATVEELEALLHTKYSIFSHKLTGEDHIACEEYHVPGHVQGHIDFITPTVGIDAVVKRSTGKRSTSAASLPVKQKKAGAVPASAKKSSSLNTAPDLSDCFAFVTPDCIRALYGIPEATTAQTGNQLGLFEDGDYYDQEDNDLFFSAFSKVPNGTHPVLDGVDGGVAPVQQIDGGAESLLDLQIIFPLIYPQGVVLYQVDDTNEVYAYQGFADTFLDALDASFCTYKGGDDPTLDPHYPDTQSGGYKGTEMCGAYTPTNVISVSYGLAEFSYSFFYEDRQCHEYMKLGLQGVSVVYASGDSGVASRGGCGGNITNPVFAPGFPASCPYVTSVGATQIDYAQPVTAPETAVNDPAFNFWSGGGFSNYWAIPDYQLHSVASYFAKHKPDYPVGTYNASGRGYPDVAANGLNIVNYVHGSPYLEGGTSASAPIFSSIITLINEKRLAVGKGPAGFLNPVLYANPSAFNDITSGSNPGCGTKGFEAVAGWDPVTGLGTVKFAKLLEVYMALP